MLQHWLDYQGLVLDWLYLGLQAKIANPVHFKRIGQTLAFLASLDPISIDWDWLVGIALEKSEDFTFGLTIYFAKGGETALEL